jgi:ABC-2 type transport system ATP-binding protein
MSALVEETTRVDTVIDVSGVSRWFGNVVAVNEITMAIGPGVTGLLGPNGAGKTTLLHMMAGLLAPSKGAVRIAGAPAWRNPDIYRSMGLVVDREAVYGFLTARELVEATAKLQRLPDPRAAAQRAIDLVELDSAADRRMATYSKGMRQRARVAAALVHEPTVLLLDEPFNGMDPRQRMHLMELLHRMGEDGRTVLFSSHILEEVEQVSRSIQVMVAGRLAASGDHRAIRRLMTQRPHEFLLRSSDDRALGIALLRLPSVSGVELLGEVVGGRGHAATTENGLRVRANDYGAFTTALAVAARDSGIRLYQVLPSDESLESVFSYLIAS